MITSLNGEKDQGSLPLDEMLGEFEKVLIDTLKAPEKNVIGNLTGMVESYLSHKDSAAVCLNVCKILERRLSEVPLNRKLAHLYLMDSIIKNLKHSQYPKLFAANLVANFTGVFRKGDEKMRKKLFELRKTWTEHFSPSLLYSLDSAVKKEDPAWPMLAATPATQQPGDLQNQQVAVDQNGRKRSHPPDSPDSTTTPAGSSGAAATTGSGDPAALQRKRPALSGGEFVIDTVGDPKVEAMAARAGRHQQQQQQSSDVDMRSGWSQYKRSSHGRQLSGDVDMRQFQTDSQQSGVAASASHHAASQLEVIAQQQAQIRRTLASATMMKPETRQQLLNTLQTLDGELNELPAAQHQQRPNHQHQAPPPPASNQIPQHVDNLLDALLQGGGGAPALFYPPALPQPPQQGHQQHFQRPQRHTEPTFKDSFRWRISVPNMPEFPQIGCDPRLLSPLRDRFEASRNIQVDGEIRQIVLDRIQPLLIINDEPHAVRFKMPPGGRILLLIDAHPPAELRINNWTKVFFGLRPYIVCLGGPFHELIVNGRPFNVPFNDQNPVFISQLGGSGSGTFGVRLQALLPNSNRPVTPSLDICPPIPRSVLRWANESAFGSPQNLYKPPFNPEEQMALPLHQRQPQAPHEEEQQQQQPQPPPQMPPPPIPVSGGLQATQPADPPAQQPSTVFEVFQNLIRHGIIKKTKAEDAPEPDLTGFQGIDKALPMIPKRLYDGYQCPQCGLRFNGEEAPDCRSHMDWHFQRRAALFGLTIRSRMWFSHWTALVKGEELLDATGLPSGAAISASSSAAHSSSSAGEGGVSGGGSGVSKKDHHHQLSRVPAFPEPSRNICGVCFETFENRWDDDAEDWMLQDCVRLPDGGIYHPICAEDAGKVKVEDSELGSVLGDSAVEVEAVEDSKDAESVSALKPEVAQCDVKPEPNEPGSGFKDASTDHQDLDTIAGDDVQQDSQKSELSELQSSADDVQQDSQKSELSDLPSSVHSAQDNQKSVELGDTAAEGAENSPPSTDS